MDRKACLFRTLTRMEAEREALVTSLAAYSTESLERKPRLNAWSVAQVITHVVIAEETALAYLHRKLDLGGHGPSTFRSALKLGLLRVALALPIKYKAPPAIAAIPDCTIAEALERWDLVRQRLHSTCSELDEALVRRELFKHPVLGKLGFNDGLRFLRTHALHHRAQVRRTLLVVQ